MFMVTGNPSAAKPPAGKGKGPSFKGNSGKGNHGGGNYGRGNYGGGYSGPKHYGNYGYNNDRHQVYLGPGGIGYGYYSRNFGITIGPTYPYGYSPYYYRSSRFSNYATGTYPTVRVQEESVAIIPTNASATDFQRQAEEAFRQQRYDQTIRRSGTARPV